MSSKSIVAEGLAMLAFQLIGMALLGLYFGAMFTSHA